MRCFVCVISLIKMLYWMCDKTGSEPNELQLEHALQRNFGGLDKLGHDSEHAESGADGNTPITIFKKHVSLTGKTPSDMALEVKAHVCIYQSLSSLVAVLYIKH